MALGVVADVDERLMRGFRDLDLVEQRARAGALLVHLDRAAVAIGVPDGVLSALGDAGQQSLGRERPSDLAVHTQAVSSNPAHASSLDLSSDDVAPPTLCDGHIVVIRFDEPFSLKLAS